MLCSCVSMLFTAFVLSALELEVFFCYFVKVLGSELQSLQDRLTSSADIHITLRLVHQPFQKSSQARAMQSICSSGGFEGSPLLVQLSVTEVKSLGFIS